MCAANALSARTCWFGLKDPPLVCGLSLSENLDSSELAFPLPIMLFDVVVEVEVGAPLCTAAAAAVVVVVAAVCIAANRCFLAFARLVRPGLLQPRDDRSLDESDASRAGSIGGGGGGFSRSAVLRRSLMKRSNLSKDAIFTGGTGLSSGWTPLPRLMCDGGGSLRNQQQPASPIESVG